MRAPSPPSRLFPIPSPPTDSQGHLLCSALPYLTLHLLPTSLPPNPPGTRGLFLLPKNIWIVSHLCQSTIKEPNPSLDPAAAVTLEPHHDGCRCLDRLAQRAPNSGREEPRPRRELQALRGTPGQRFQGELSPHVLPIISVIAVIVACDRVAVPLFPGLPLPRPSSFFFSLDSFSSAQAFPQDPSFNSVQIGRVLGSHVSALPENDDRRSHNVQVGKPGLSQGK